MASTTTDPELIATLLNRLERLNSDEYVLAFGPAGKHFFAGPDGYAA
jgi:methylenetetrahydrofolate dehydrogenase (NADP+)/methenyltetrahydrofolate cyclohydrolase/formyltetrahydrofolate synthetase